MPNVQLVFFVSQISQKLRAWGAAYQHLFMTPQMVAGKQRLFCDLAHPVLTYATNLITNVRRRFCAKLRCVCFAGRSEIFPHRVRRTYNLTPPWLLVETGKKLFRLTLWMQDAIIPPPLRIADLAFTSFTSSHVLLTLCQLGIPDFLAAGPQTALALSQKLGALKSPSLCLPPLNPAFQDGPISRLHIPSKPVPTRAGRCTLHNLQQITTFLRPHIQADPASQPDWGIKPERT